MTFTINGIGVSEYETTTGKILFMLGFQSEEAFLLNRRDGFGYVDGQFDGALYYVVNGEAVARPDSPVTIDGRTLSDVPPCSTLWIDGESYEAEGDVELDFVMPGTYKLRVVCFPYLDWEYDLVML